VTTDTLTTTKSLEEPEPAAVWPPEAPPRARVDLMGMGIDPLTEEEVRALVRDALVAGSGGWIVTPNVDHLRLFRGADDLRALYGRADLVLADGMPLIWASRLRGTPLPARVPGSDLVWVLSSVAAEAGASAFLLGGNPGVADLAAEELERRFPGLRIAGTMCPPRGFEHDPAEMERIRATLAAVSPSLVYVALGFPKAERLIDLLRSVLPRAWFVGVGISLSFVCGDVARAPRWMQTNGLEWIHRLLMEPRRLFKRYVVHDAPFALRLLGHAAWHRVTRRVRDEA
jgi:N-acetylglucosaminyldiphosphoundecaprenol N-acetyl-beta-D-mannosaminyltransferase